MKRVMAVSLFLAPLLILGSVSSQQAQLQPKVVTPNSLVWSSPPNWPHIKSVWVLGAESRPESYALRVILMKGGRIPPHTHPDTRYSTVLSGTLYVGFGEVVDDSKLVAVPEGAVYVAPARVAHYLIARDGDVVYQEGGTGPTATVPIKK
jgi:quercetin dioxygenase-like cupin family protein